MAYCSGSKNTLVLNLLNGLLRWLEKHFGFKSIKWLIAVARGKETCQTYWKLFGSPEFQFSKVSGFPVDIQKNLPQFMWTMTKTKDDLRNYVKNKNDDEDGDAGFFSQKQEQQAPSGIGHWEEVSSCHLICWVCRGGGEGEGGREGGESLLYICNCKKKDGICYSLALLCLVSATGPKVLMAHTWTRNIC